MFNFENLHRNKKMAFLDGFLTASVIVGFVTHKLHKRSFQEMEEEHEKKLMDCHHRSFKAGWNSSTQSLYPYIDDEHYKKIYGHSIYEED